MILDGGTATEKPGELQKRDCRRPLTQMKAMTVNVKVKVSEAAGP